MQQIRNFNEDFNSILNLYPERIACEVINGEELIVTYNDLDIRVDNSAYTAEFRKKIKEGVTNSKDFFQSFLH